MTALALHNDVAYIPSHADISKLTHEQFLETFKAYKESEGTKQIELQNKIVKSNIAFVIRTAKQYSNRGIPLSDLINEGCIGLIKALKKYSLNWNCKFTTYAENWIRHQCRITIANQTRIVRLPIYIIRLIYKFNKNKTKLSEMIGREASDEEVFDFCEFNEKDSQKLKLVLNRHTHSIDEKASSEDNGDYKDIIPDRKTTSTEQIMEEQDRKNKLQEAINKLSMKEKTVIIGRKQGETLEQVGNKLGVTRERARQLEIQAVSKLKKLLN